jgi:HD-like signal output (HDOD) protein
MPSYQYRLETLPGSSTLHLQLEGQIDLVDADFSTYLSNLSLKRVPLIINILGLEKAVAALFDILGDLSTRTRIKVVGTRDDLVQKSTNSGLQVFPTLKSAILAITGDETVNTVLTRLRDVPVLNSDAYRLFSYVSQGDPSFGKLEEMVRESAGLVSQILRLANSSFFLRSSRAETLQQALVTLGFRNLAQLFVYNFYQGVGNMFQVQQDVLEHGKACGSLAEFIGRSAGASAEECARLRLGGLLHDIGQQALAFCFPQQFALVRQKMREEQRPSFLIELMVFGIEHQAIGSILFEKWNFPPYLAAIIGDHHYLQAAHWNALTLPVFCANNFLHEEEGSPFQPYFQKLEGYFFLKKKEMPWIGPAINEAFRQFLAAPRDPFSVT